MKSVYRGWIVIIAAVVLGLLVVALSPKWRHAETVGERMQQSAEQSLERGLPPGPGEGRVTSNLPMAMRLHLPILAVFNRHMQEHLGGPEQVQRQAQEKAEHQMFANIAADYKGVLAVVEVTASSSPASIVRAKVTSFPTQIIYRADQRELWRHEGEVTEKQLRAKLSALKIQPRKTDTAAGSPGSK